MTLFAGPHTLDLWLEGRLAGHLMRAETGEVEFAYRESYRNNPRATPLSVTMPLIGPGYGPDLVMPWISNLLPDEDGVRDRWAAKFGSRDSSPFGLLRHMGQDAPGAVQIVPQGVEPVDTGSLTPVSHQKIAERVTGIIADPDHWVDDSGEDASRFSLAGTQGKFALAKVGAQWFDPNGRTPSTHIVKPGMKLQSGATNSEVMAVEFVTMRTASRLEIQAAEVEIVDFDGVLAFVTARYDRVAGGAAGPVRIHQEDFCQALSLYPGRKYEAEGGPTMADMHALISRTSTGTAGFDSARLARLFAFNLLIAGVDAHAKNHSLLLHGNQVRLAPAYDLISAHGLWAEARVMHRSGPAVKYGRTRHYKSITARNLARTADVLGESRAQFKDRLMSMVDPLITSMERSISELPVELLTERVTEMPTRVVRFVDGMRHAIGGMDLSFADLPRFAEQRNLSRVTSQVWVSGRYEGDRWVLGRYMRAASRESSRRE